MYVFKKLAHMKINEIMLFLKAHPEIENWIEFTRKNWNPVDEKF